MLRNKGTRLFVLLLFLAAGLVSRAQTSERNNPGYIDWGELPSIPASAGGEAGLGLAGHFSGVHNDVLLVAGGTNFPEKGRPWDGGEKKWYDEVHVLENSGGGYHWADSVFHLPYPLAYGAAVTTDQGLVCIGGTDGVNYHSEVLLLTWNVRSRMVEIARLPSLPRPLAYMSATLMNGSIYVAGGEGPSAKGVSLKLFLKLDLGKKGSPGFQWEQMPSWPGPGRVTPVLAAQNSGNHDCLYLFSGRETRPGKETLLFDVYMFDPVPGEWKRRSDIDLGDGKTRCLTGAPAMPAGLNHILIFGGADNPAHRLFRKTQSAFNQAGNASEKEYYRRQLDSIADHHPGFSKEVLAYHTLTDKWVRVGEFQGPAPVMTPAARWGDAIVIAGGEIAPATRAAKVWTARIVARESSVLGWVDYLLITLYFLTILYIGYKYKKNVKTTNDYYKAGGRVPGWASGVAIFGTLLSAITFLTTPAKTYNESWIYFLPTISSLVLAPFIVFYIIPVYFRLNATTAYEYLEKRFSPLLRVLGSLSFLAFQVAKFGVMLLLPALAISAITGIDVMTCILVIGLFSTVYGTLGGIEAVVWTEVLQVVIFLLAALLSVVVVALRLEGGFGDIIAINHDFGKFDFVNWDFSFSEITAFVAVSYWIGGGLVPYISDQTVIQKYLVTKDSRSAARGVWLNGILIVLSSALFFSIGSALFAYYAVFPEKLNPSLPTPESIYPWFIVNELPAGAKGVVVAGIFAVAMSTISSTMNSMSAATVTDISRFRPVSPKRQLSLAKTLSAVFGLIGTAIAAVMFLHEVGSLWDMIRRLTGLLTGGLAGLFLLGIFTRRANQAGALVGFIGSAFVQYYISGFTPVHFMVYSLTGMASCFVIGYLASLLIPVQSKHNSE